MAYISPFHGKWALVTGASSGIGAALARELAGRGAKLILTARRRDRLETLGQELAADGTETRIIVADLNDPVAPHQIYRVTERAGIEVEILVNNAGLGQYGAFHTSDIEQEMSQVRVNCDAVVQLSRLFVPRMVERKRGWVLVVASTASFQPMPYFATYAASKAFDRFFALGLAEEVAQYDVKVTALCPGPTESEFFDVARAGIFNRSAQPVEQVVRQAVEGLERGQRTVIPNFRGWLGAHIVRLVPTSLVTRLLEKTTRPKDAPRAVVPAEKKSEAGK
jgi:short-subunit dehydrogenase